MNICIRKENIVNICNTREDIKMKPTRHIVKPNTSYWKPKHNVWFKKNDDFKKNDAKENAREIYAELKNLKKEKLRRYLPIICCRMKG